MQNVENEEFSQIFSILSLSKIQCLSISQKGPYQIFQFLSFSNKGVKWPIFPLTDHLDSKFSPEGPNASPWLIFKCFKNVINWRFLLHSSSCFSSYCFDIHVLKFSTYKVLILDENSFKWPSNITFFSKPLLHFENLDG